MFINEGFETERMLLRPAAPELAEAVLEYMVRNEAHLKPWEPLKPPGFYTLRHQRALLEVFWKEQRKGRALRCWMVLKATGTLVGAVNLTQIVREPFQSCYLGYKTDVDHVGQGLMTEAVEKMVDVAFNTLGLHRVEANIIPRNTASRRVLEKSGFLLEGHSPKYLRINGRWEDHDRYALLNPREDAYAD